MYKRQLQSLVDEANTLDPDDYIQDEAFDTFTTVLAEAEELLLNADAGQADVDAKAEALTLSLIHILGDQEIIDGQQYIRDKLEEWIPYYVDAQEENGYFDTYFILGANGNTPKWWDFNLHELYCAGHFYEAAVAHYRATNRRVSCPFVAR